MNLLQRAFVEEMDAESRQKLLEQFAVLRRQQEERLRRLEVERKKEAQVMQACVNVSVLRDKLGVFVRVLVRVLVLVYELLR